MTEIQYVRAAPQDAMRLLLLAMLVALVATNEPFHRVLQGKAPAAVKKTAHAALDASLDAAEAAARRVYAVTKPS